MGGNFDVLEALVMQLQLFLLHPAHHNGIEIRNISIHRYKNYLTAIK
jgi:hypothetical protein